MMGELVRGSSDAILLSVKCNATRQESLCLWEIGNLSKNYVFPHLMFFKSLFQSPWKSFD